MPAAPVDLLMIRHAEADNSGRLAGRTDVPALLPGGAEIAAARSVIGEVDEVFVSPARRCRMTAEALFPDRDLALAEPLWEQDFGTYDGTALTDLPDLGAMSRDKLAAHRWPKGESFIDMGARVSQCLQDLLERSSPGSRITIVAHAGTARAALGMALGEPAQGLAFDIAPLSLTRLRWFGDAFAIGEVNRRMISG